MFLSEELIEQAINNLAKSAYSGGRSGNSSLLSYYLIFRALGFNAFKTTPLNAINDNKELVSKLMWMFGGCFDSNEAATKKGVLFFTEFNDFILNKNQKSFFNPATAFPALPGRLKDTVDNAAADHLFDLSMDENKNKLYSFQNDVEQTIASQYHPKYKLADLLIWLYRFQDFESEVTFDDLFQMFLHDFSLPPEIIFTLLDKNAVDISFQVNAITGSKIREILNIDETEFDGSKKVNELFEIKPISKNEIMTYKKGNHVIDSEYLKKLLDRHKQIVLTGVPGTGKSFIVDELVKEFDGFRKVQFHQSFTYQDFVIGKTLEGGNVKYENGVFLDLIKEALEPENHDKNYLLIIDEINRGNISAIFGELLYLLDRDKEISIRGLAESVTLPDNVYIVGSMNSTDRSIALVDYAIRRRFLFIEMQPDYSLIDSLSTFNGKKLLGKFLEKVNNNIQDYFGSDEFRLGHSYLINGVGYDWSNQDLFEVIHYKISPMLKEYASDNFEVVVSVLGQEILDSSIEDLETNLETFLES